MAFPKLRALLLAAALAAAPAHAHAPAQPRYELRLDERSPLRAEMTLILPDAAEERIGPDPAAERALAAEPRCPTGPLKRLAPGFWLKPAGCRRVSWSAHLTALDPSGSDASRPASGWSAAHRLWLVAATLPWLRGKAEAPASVVAVARFANAERITRRFTRSPAGAPLAVVVALRPAQRYRANGMEMRLYGSAPASSPTPISSAAWPRPGPSGGATSCRRGRAHRGRWTCFGCGRHRAPSPASSRRAVPTPCSCSTCLIRQTRTTR